MARTKVFVVAEGPSEIGDLDQLAGGGRGARSAEGYIPPILRKCLGERVEITTQRVSRFDRGDKPVRVKGHGVRAAMALALALVDGCDVLVFVKDVDRQPGRKKSALERRNKIATMHEQIEEGFASVDGAENVVRAKATPCRTIEAWALGDATALAAVARTSVRAAKLTRRPEELWGADSDPASDHPKCVLERSLGARPTSRVFEDLARESSPKRPRLCARHARKASNRFAREMDSVVRRLKRRSA